MFINWLPAAYFAQAYGRGLHGRGLYSADKPADTIQIGPITLPVTGVGGLAILCALLLALAAYLYVVYRQRKVNSARMTIGMLLLPVTLAAVFLYFVKI